MKKLVLSAFAAAALIGMPQASSAASITLDVMTTFSGSTPGGVISATFTDVVGGVQLTMDASGLAAGEFVTEWSFNFDPTLDATDLAVAWQSGAKSDVTPGPPPQDGTVDLGNNLFKANGTGGFYDISFVFASGPPASRLGPSSIPTSVYLFTLAGITVDSFNFEAVGKDGDPTAVNFFNSAAHIQGIDADPSSGWVGLHPGDDEDEDTEEPSPVPEPASFALLGFGGLLLVGQRFLRRKV